MNACRLGLQPRCMIWPATRLPAGGAAPRSSGAAIRIRGARSSTRSGRPPSRRWPSFHRFGPSDMPLEAKLCRHVAVAIPIVPIGLFIDPCLRQQGGNRSSQISFSTKPGGRSAPRPTSPPRLVRLRHHRRHHAIAATQLIQILLVMSRVASIPGWCCVTLAALVVALRDQERV
jgi:hypothetical protein